MDYGSWFDYTLEMERFIEKNPDYPIHVMYYEDLKEVRLKLIIIRFTNCLEMLVNDTYILNYMAMIDLPQLNNKVSKMVATYLEIIINSLAVIIWMVQSRYNRVVRTTNWIERQLYLYCILYPDSLRN